MPFDVQGALKAGYTVDEIGGHVGFDVAGAKQAGYSDDEIMNHLAGGAAQPKTQQSAPAEKGFFSGLVDPISNPKPSAVRDFSPTLGSALNVAGTVGNFAAEKGMEAAKGLWGLVPDTQGKRSLEAVGKGILTEGGRIIKNSPLGALANLPEGVKNDVSNLAGATMVYPAGKLVSAAGKEGFNIARDVGTTIISKTPEMLDKQLTGVINRGVEKAIRPSVVGKGTASQTANYFARAKTAVKTIVNNKDNLILTDINGNPATGLPKTLKQFSESIEQSKRSIFDKYHTMATEAGDAGAIFDAKPILTELDKASVNLKNNPQIRQYASDLKAEIGELHGQPPDIIEARIADLNSSLNGFYEGRVSKAKAQVDASVAAAMREELDNNIMNAVGPGYQDLKKTYGSLKTIEKEVAHRAIVDARKNIKGLADMTDVFTGGEIVGGILSMNPAMIARGAAGKGIKEYIKYLNSPDRIVKGMFSDAENLLNRVKMPQPVMRSATDKLVDNSFSGLEGILQKDIPGAVPVQPMPGQANASRAVGPVRSGVLQGEAYGPQPGRLIYPKQLPAGQGFELQGAPTSPDVIDARFTSTSRPIPALPAGQPGRLALPQGQGFELVDQPKLNLEIPAESSKMPAGSFKNAPNIKRLEEKGVNVNALAAGTPAIRESVLETLISQGYITSAQKGIILKELESFSKPKPTTKGKLTNPSTLNALKNTLNNERGSLNIGPVTKKPGTANIPAKTTPQAEAGIEAWHGSPHTINRFSTSRIGTGQRSQSYGYGLYFTDSREVGEHYKKILADSSDRLSMPLQDAARLIADRTNQIAKEKGSSRFVTPEDIIGKMSRIIDHAIEDGGDSVKKYLGYNPEDRFAAAIGVLAEGSPKIYEGILDKEGRLYKVKLTPGKDEYLLWDKPLSEQSDKVKDALKKAGVNESIGTGGSAYWQIVRSAGSDKAASDHLYSLGIRGIKYLDAKSRGKGDGSNNYVIFSDADIINIELHNPTHPPEAGKGKLVKP